MWTDKCAAKQFLLLRDKFKMDIMMETGTAHGVNAQFYSQYFGRVLSCDNNIKMVRAARERNAYNNNVFIALEDSVLFLKLFVVSCKYRTRLTSPVLILLDAHYTNIPVLEE